MATADPFDADTLSDPAGSDVAARPAEIEAMVERLGAAARAASRALATSSAAVRNQALLAAADAIDARATALVDINADDVRAAREGGLDAALLDRLELTPARVAGMSAGLRGIAAQADPIGSLSATTRQPSGLEIARMRVPLGVIGVIYESRPNVTADAGALCLKSGNAVILRGGSEALHSNRAIAECMQSGLEAAGLPLEAIQLVPTTDRQAVGALLRLDRYLDVLVPRGGKSLVARVADEARVPVIKHLDGICHVYVDEAADPAMAVEVAFNAKTFRYGICGAMETLLVHEAIAETFLPAIASRLDAHGVELRGCEASRRMIQSMVPATERDWETEYLGPILSVRVVESIEAAMAHIERYGSGHTDAIVTGRIDSARRFVQQVDSSSVMVNAATCFADGAEYGLGAEIGISTDRLHVRGPVGALGLTTEKYVVTGDGTVRR